MGDSLGDREVRRLFEQHGPMVLRRAQRLLGNPDDAREAVQEVFIRVMRGASGFEHRAQATTWLYRITTNYCLSRIRDQKRRRELLGEHVRSQPEPSGPASPSDLLLLRRLLRDADEQQAQAAIYVYLDGMSHREAAELMDVSKRTVGNLLERFERWAKTYVADAPDTEATEEEV